MRRYLIGALILATIPSVPAQQTFDPRFGESIEVRLINVDVVVRDKGGNPVRGLTADDFVIYENGVAQPVTNFAEYRAADPGEDAPGTASPAVAVRPPEKRYLLFFIDHLNLRETLNREEFFIGLREFVSSSIREGDEAAVFFWGTSLETTVPMTAVRSKIVDAIAKIEEESKLRIDQTDLELAELEMRKQMWERDSAAEEADKEAMKNTDKRFAAQRALDRQQKKINAINYVIQSAAGLDGRKVMILATDRLSKLPGLEYGWGYEANEREFTARKQMDSVVRNANSAAVTVYGFFPRGLDKDLPESSSTASKEIEVYDAPMTQTTQSYHQLMNQAEPIDSISTRTGGMAALGGRLSRLALADTSRQLDNYYSLGYHAPDDRLDRTRKIKVEVNRPDVDVLARSAVVDKSGTEVMRDRVVSGILFGKTRSTIPIQVSQRGIEKTGMTTYTVSVEIRIPISDLTALPGPNGYEGSFRVFTVAANPDGEVSEVAEKEQAFHYPESQLRKARSGTYVYRLDIKVRDTSDRALIAVVDALDGDTGYAEIALDGTSVTKAQRPVVIPTGPVDTRIRPVPR